MEIMKSPSVHRHQAGASGRVAECRSSCCCSPRARTPTSTGRTGGAAPGRRSAGRPWTEPRSTRASSPVLTGHAASRSDGKHIYWGNQLTATIGRANLDGTGVDRELHHRDHGRQPPLLRRRRLRAHLLGRERHQHRPGQPGRDRASSETSSPARTASAACRSTRSMSTGETTTDVNSIGRANLDGTGVNQSFIPNAVQGSGLHEPSNPVVESTHHLLRGRREHAHPAREPRRERGAPELHHRRQQCLARARLAATCSGPSEMPPADRAIQASMAPGYPHARFGDCDQAVSAGRGRLERVQPRKAEAEEERDGRPLRGRTRTWSGGPAGQGSQPDRTDGRGSLEPRHGGRLGEAQGEAGQGQEGARPAPDAAAEAARPRSR